MTARKARSGEPELAQLRAYKRLVAAKINRGEITDQEGTRMVREFAASVLAQAPPSANGVLHRVK